MTITQETLAQAYASHQRGELDAAERAYRDVLAGDPKNPDALYLLGMLCLDTGRAESAAGFFEQAIEAAEAGGARIDPGWRLALGAARQGCGDHGSALQAFEVVLREDPQSADASFCAGTALTGLGRREEAIAAYRRAVAANPRHAEAANNLGGLLRDSGQMTEAARFLYAAVKLRPDYPEALLNLGQLLETMGRFEEAAGHLSRALALSPGDADAACILARCLSLIGRVEEAAAILEQQRQRRPEDSQVLARLAAVRLYQGEREGAADLCVAALRHDPDCVEAHHRLSETGLGDPNEHFAQLDRTLARADLTTGDRAQLHYARAARLEALGRDEKAFRDYSRGAALRRESLAEVGMAYDPDAHRRRVDALIAAFGKGRFANPMPGSDSEIPVFIVGMPRSGTSLVEQIVASHSEAAGAGELMVFGNAARALSAKAGYPDQPVPEPALHKLADGYLKRLGRDAAGAARITDKMPTNFMNLGLIALTFPRARIIHCRRDPVDTCLSCFAHSFAGPGQAFSYDLAELGHYYGEYARLMAHWGEVLPLEILDVDYERLVADQEAESRRLIAFLGLQWDPACLAFHESRRAVVTASHSQVRQPIYASSIGRAARFRKWLGPLLEALSQAGVQVDPA